MLVELSKHEIKCIHLKCTYTSKDGSWYLGPSWSRSYNSWIYNYLCNQCLSPLMLWVRILLIQGGRYTTLCDKVCQW